MQIRAESGKSALPICNYSQILYQFLTFTQNLKRSRGSNYYAIGTASGSKHSTNNLTEDTFIECYVSQMIYAIQPLDCSYLPLS